MFSLVDMGERAGTGIPSIYYAWEEAFKLKPTLVDKHNPDRTEMFVPRFTATSVKESAVNEVSRTVNNDSRTVNDDSRTVNNGSRTVIDDPRTVNRPTKESRKEQIIELLKQNKALNPIEIGERLGINAATLRHYIHELVAEGKIGFTGTFRNRTYHIIKK